MVFDILGFGFWIGVVPSGIGIFLTLDHQGVITRGAFPETITGGVAITKILVLEGVWGKVMIAFDNFTLITFCEGDPVPNCFCHWFYPER